MIHVNFTAPWQNYAMIHFIPDSAIEASHPLDTASGPYAEAVARLSSIRQALACVEHFSGDPPSETMAESGMKWIMA